MTEADIPKLIESDEEMMRVLRAAKSLNLPDWWVGAGFVRNKVWNTLTGQNVKPGDIDLAYFNQNDQSEERDQEYEVQLKNLVPEFDWEVKNQVRMHEANNDSPYTSTLDAIRHWPETATAVAVTLDESDYVVFEAAYGTEDLLNMIIRPTLPFSKDPAAVERRLKKGWQSKWPEVRIITNLE